MTSTTKAIEHLKKVVELFASTELPKFVQSAFLESDGSKPSGRWSMGNRVLMFWSGTADARGIKQWRSIQRTIKRGTHAIYILAPVMHKVKKTQPDGTEETEDVMTGYRCQPVFRYEDTEPFPGIKPEDAQVNTVKAPKSLPPLADVAEKWGITIRYDESVQGEEGSFSEKTSEIRLCTAEHSTFWHELAHKAHSKIEKLKSGQDPEQEAIAQLSACVLARMYGEDADNFTYHYIKAYSEGNKPEDVGRLCFKVLTKTERVLKTILDAHVKTPLIAQKAYSKEHN